MNGESSVAVESKRDLRSEVALVWRLMPAKSALGVLLLVWVALFQWWGNSTLGYTKTPSLFGWMQYAYSMSADDRHGYLVPLLVLGLLWWKRGELVAIEKRAWWPALGLLALALALHWVGFVVQQTRLSVAAFFLGVYALTGVVWGWRWLVASCFPFFLFVFCVPLGNSAEIVTVPLRLLATKITVEVANTGLGVGAMQMGTSIFEPNGKYQYEVAAACSGIRSLTAIFVLAAAFGFVSLRSWWRRALMLASAVPLAVVSNVVRLMMIIIAAETFGQAAGNAVHNSSWFSLVPYVPAILGILGLGHLLRERSGARSDGPVTAGDGESSLSRARLGSWMAAVAALGVMGAGVFSIKHQQAVQVLGKPGIKVVAEPTYGEAGQIIKTESAWLPPRVLDYSSYAVPIPKVVEEMLPQDTVYGHRIYTNQAGFRIDQNIVLMGADRTSIHQPQYCLTGAGFRVDREERLTVPVAQPHRYDLPVTRLIGTRRQRIAGQIETVRCVYVYWFVADGQLSADHRQRMWWLARDLIRTGVLQRWAYVTCASLCRPGEESATFERIKGFIAASAPEFQLAAGERLGKVAAQ